MLEYGIGEEYPKVAELTAEYCQEDDCESEDRNRVQRLILKSVDNGCVPFIRIYIPHENGDPGYWSISGIEDLKMIVKDFEQKLNYKEKK